MTRLELYLDGMVELDGYIGRLQKLDNLGIAGAVEAGELQPEMFDPKHW